MSLEAAPAPSATGAVAVGVDPAIEEEKVLLRLQERTESSHANEELKALYKAFSARANSNGMLDFVGFQKGLTEICPDLNGELLFFLMTEDERSNVLNVEQTIVFLSKVIHMTFLQRIKLLFQLATKHKEDNATITKQELVQFFHKVAPLLHHLEDNDPLYSTPLLSPTISMRALSAAMKDEPLGSSPQPSSSFPQPSSSFPSPNFLQAPALVNIHAPQKNTSVGHLTETSSIANQLVINAMTHTLALDQIQLLIDECFGFSALNPDKSTLTYQEFQTWFLDQKRVATLYKAEEHARREQQKLQLEIKVSIKVQELIDCNKFTEEEVKCIRNIFNQFDSDGSGEINTKKIQSVFEDATDDELQEFMTELDPKDLGYVTFDRFLEILGPYLIQESEAAYEAAAASSPPPTSSSSTASLPPLSSASSASSLSTTSSSAASLPTITISTPSTTTSSTNVTTQPTTTDGSDATTATPTTS
eukprot:TRINITY_DN12969_c0_g1_i1.p1 TRINITY_DN12969_c0_g1~~TRINITY_DN12969_c0_g1_i1.p1  ORF type:complete len:476 (+),score=143.02 TRINITY_DN12969_c0_g1_i1:341-1768(+)